MKSVSPAKKYLFLGILFLTFPLLIWFLSKMDHSFRTLPFYHPIEFVDKPDGTTDTIWHTIPDFSFINQDGEIVTQDYFEGHIYVADFFFTTCPSICPVMTTQMRQLYWKLDKKSYQDVYFLSHTVNPEYDTPEILKAYADKLEVDYKRWMFVTGEKEKIYQQGLTGYFLSAQEDVMAPGGFLHSEMFVLVDKEMRIRGYYDGTSSDDVGRLAEDIALLMAEYKKLAREDERKNS